MKSSKAKDLRDKSVEELETLISDERKALHKARRDLVFRQNSDTTGIATRRHNIARALTILGEKKRSAQ